MQEERLRKPVTVRHKMVLLPDLLRDIGKQTGVNLTCTRDLSADKLTVFVQEKPASEVLTHIATLIMGEWRKTKEGYSLSQKAQAQKWEEELLAMEMEQIRREARQAIEHFMSIASKDYSQWLKETEEARKQIFSKGAPRIQTPDGKELPIAPESLSSLYPRQIAPRISEYLAGWLFRQFRQEHWQTLWRGQTFIASTLDLPGAWRLPPEALQWARESVVPVFAQDNEFTQQYLRFWQERNASTSGVIVAVGYAPSTGLVVTMWRITPTGAFPEPTFSGDRVWMQKIQHPLLHHWKQWQTPETEVGKLPLLKTSMRIPLAPQTSYLPIGMFAPAFQPISLADWLDEAVKACDGGLQVIADAYRCNWTQAKVNDPNAKSLGEWLKVMFTPRGDRPPSWWRVEGDYLLIKHYEYWLLRRTELPEQKVRSLEAKAEKAQRLTLDDYASIASSMNLLHELRMATHSYTLRFDPNPLKEYRFLHLWAGLNAGQRALLLQSGSLPIGTLTPQQQALLVDYVSQSLLMRMTGSEASLQRSASEPTFPTPALQMQYQRGERYELVSERSWFAAESLQSVREFADRLFTEGHLEPGYRIQGFYTDTYALRMALLPNLRWDTQIIIRKPMPLTEKRE